MKLAATRRFVQQAVHQSLKVTVSYHFLVAVQFRVVDLPFPVHYAKVLPMLTSCAKTKVL
jgi:hypothetical protein